MWLLQIASMQQQLTAATAACSVSEQESQQLRANVGSLNAKLAQQQADSVQQASAAQEQRDQTVQQLKAQLAEARTECSASQAASNALLQKQADAAASLTTQQQHGAQSSAKVASPPCSC